MKDAFLNWQIYYKTIKVHPSIIIVWNYQDRVFCSVLGVPENVLTEVSAALAVLAANGTLKHRDQSC